MRGMRCRLLLVATLLGGLLPGTSMAAPDDTTSRLEQAEAALAALDERTSMAVEDYNEAAALLERLQTQRAETEVRVGALSTEIAELEGLTAAFVRQMYMRGPSSSLAIVLDADEVADAGRNLAVMDRITRHRHAQLELLGVRRGELDAAQDALATQVATATEREQSLARVQADLDAMLADQRGEVQALRDEVERARRLEEQRRRAAEERAAEERAAEAAAAAAPPPAPAPPPPPAPAPVGTRQGADTAIQAAMSQLGKPYRYGASGPDAYDCSGLTSWAWAQAGVQLPRSSRMQYAGTTRISRDDVRPGDLVFYGSPIHHVAMYIGDTSVVEAPYTGANVRVRDDGMLRDDIVGYGRV